MQAAHHLTGGEPKRGLPSKRRIAIDVPRGERLLEPVDAAPLQGSGTGDRGRYVPGRAAIAGHAPSLVDIDHDREIRSQRVPDLLYHLEVFTPVGVIEADLGGAHAALAQRLQTANAFLGWHALTARGVADQTIGPAAQQQPERRVQRSSDQVPDGDLRRPGPAAMKVDRLTDLTDHLGLKGIDAAEEMLELLAVGKRRASRDAGQSLVRVDDDQRFVDVVTRNRIPGRVERRIERIAIMPGFDRGNAQLSGLRSKGCAPLPDGRRAR